MVEAPHLARLHGVVGLDRLRLGADHRLHLIGDVVDAHGCALLLGCYPEEPGPTGTQTSAGLLESTLLPPSSFMITSGDSTHVRFVWKDESIRETGYVLERNVNGGAFENIMTLPANADSVTYYSRLNENITYGFRMRSRRDEFVSGPTQTVTLSHDQAFHFVKFHRVDGLIYDGVFRLSVDRSSMILSGDQPSVFQFTDLGFHGDSLVLIGRFTSVTGLATLRAAVWYGGRWSPFGEGIQNGSPMVLIPTPNGLYAGAQISFVSSSYMYRWNGERFAPIEAIGLNRGGAPIGGASYGGITYIAFDMARRNDPQQTPVAVASYLRSNLLTTPQPPGPFLSYYRQTGIAALTDGLYLSLARIENPSMHTIDTTLLRFDGYVWSVADVSPTRQVVHGLTSWNDELFSIRIILNSLGIEVRSEIQTWTGTAFFAMSHVLMQSYSLKRHSKRS